MKKLMILSLALIAVCLAVVAYDRLVPAAAVHAACAQSPQVSSVSLQLHEAQPVTGPSQPAVVVGAGLVSVLLAVLAVSPLLVGDPDQVNRGL